jgi:hypothetical protein
VGNYSIPDFTSYGCRDGKNHFLQVPTLQKAVTLQNLLLARFLLEMRGKAITNNFPSASALGEFFVLKQLR